MNDRDTIVVVGSGCGGGGGVRVVFYDAGN